MSTHIIQWQLYMPPQGSPYPQAAMPRKKSLAKPSPRE
jgi:hypothetical protein